MNYYKNKYRQNTTRLKNWDYSSPCAYFVTIRTKDGEYYFGDIENNKMKFSEIGRIAYKYFAEIIKRYPNTIIDDYVIMPNHVHGLILITDENGNFYFRNYSISNTVCSVMPRHDATVMKPIINSSNKNKFGGLVKNSIPSIINHYKGDVTKYAKNNEIGFQWQPRFYDRIVRDKDELFRIKRYIVNNPKNWERDKNNSDKILM